MKKVFYLLSIVFLGACSSPKYTASFNSYKSPSDIHEAKDVAHLAVINTSVIIASTSAAPVEINAVNMPGKGIRKTYLQMSKPERRALRNHLHKEIKAYLSDRKKSIAPNSAKTTQSMDDDLKLAAIFGAVGIVGLLLASGADVFWIIGGIALIIGVVFFAKWVVRQ